MPTLDDCHALYREFAETERQLHDLLPPSTEPLNPGEVREPVLGADQVTEVSALIDKARAQWEAYIECSRNWSAQG